MWWVLSCIIGTTVNPEILATKICNVFVMAGSLREYNTFFLICHKTSLKSNSYTDHCGTHAFHSTRQVNILAMYKSARSAISRLIGYPHVPAYNTLQRNELTYIDNSCLRGITEGLPLTCAVVGRLRSVAKSA